MVYKRSDSPFYRGGRRVPASWLLLTLWIGASPALSGEDSKRPDPAAIEFFESRVRPVLAENCFGCHGPEKQKAGMRLDSLAGMLAGGASGPILVPGDPGRSRIVLAIGYGDADLRMPPSKKLGERQIQDITRWVKLGAPWPASLGPPSPAGGSEAKPARSVRKPLVVTDEDRAWWAFRPVHKPAPPRVKKETWPAHCLDRFILARLEAEGLEPSPPATRRELIRRASFDLLGLPPAPEEVAEFERDDSPESWERLVDRLLAHQRYGERWGRHWLDVVRYGDSNGYERDGEKPLSWRYRDYAIASFNADKPYDLFIREQLAGDEIEGFHPDAIIATGFYRLGIWDDEPDDARMAEYEYLDDIVRTTGAAFLGVTIGCARCHDHMFDPIPQRDYYRMLAFFRNVRQHEQPKFALSSATFAPLATSEAITEWKSEIERKDRELAARIAGTGAAEEKKKLEEERKRLKDAAPPFEWALAVREQGPAPLKTHVLIRGDAATSGPEVEPGFLEVMPRWAGPQAAQPRGETTGRRSRLSDWIADPANPLTARVMVNRIWQHYFGRGIVPTPNDFGKTGLPPTHPDLLDWLAAEFTEGGWSMKRIQRLILTSSAYRMSSHAPNENTAARDPANRLFWRQNLRRLEAEPLRDSILATSGELSTAGGGRGFFPSLGREVIASQSRPGDGWGTSTAEERRRASVYAFVKRTLLVPFFENFDYTNTTQPVDERSSTTVAPQALMLLNSDFMQEQAAALADRVRCEAGEGAAARIERAYRLALGRAPSEAEREIALAHLARQEKAISALAPSETFTPLLPSTVHGPYLRRLKPEEYLAGPREGWSYHRGRWGNGYEGLDAVDPVRGPFALRKDLRVADGAIEASFHLHPSAELGGLIARGEAAGSGFKGYDVTLDPRRGAVTLRRHDGEMAQVLAEAAAGISGGQVHRLRLDLAGPRLRVWLDGSTEPLIDRTDPKPILGAGSFGFKAWGAPVRVTDVALKVDGQRREFDFRPLSAREPAQAAAAASRQAFESLCLVILNLNEFVYVD